MIATKSLMHAPLPWRAHLKAKACSTWERAFNRIFFTTFLDMGAERASAHERHKVRKEASNLNRKRSQRSGNLLSHALGLEENLGPRL